MSAPPAAAPHQYAALVLAGRREARDPLAEAAGAPHRAFVEVAGVPTLQRVVDTLLGSGRISEVLVSIDAPRLVEDVAGLAAHLGTSPPRLRVVASADSPSLSVLAGLAELPDQPVLVTTADHALLTADMLAHFLADAETSGADLGLALVPASLIRDRFPESRRTYLPFRGESYSGANLFLFRTPAARRAAEFWTRAEQFRKQPWKLVRFFGLGSLALFALRRLDLPAAMRRVSRTVGAEVHAVEMPDAEAAVDVDSLEDLRLADRLAREREGR